MPQFFTHIPIWSLWWAQETWTGSIATTYNSVLVLGKKTEYNEALRFLQFILESPEKLSYGDLYELSGDIHYLLDEAHERVIDMYQRAYESTPSVRLAKKIQYLQNSIYNEQHTLWSDWYTEDANTLDSTISDAMQEIRDDQRSRSDMMNTLPWDGAFDIDRAYLRSVLDGNQSSSEKDW